MGLTRRNLLGATAAAGLAGATGAARWPGDHPAYAAHPEYAALPDPGASGIEHVVVVMMENRSFDHFLGWLPGADGKQAGLRYRDRYGRWHPTHRLEAFASCGFADPDHSFEGGRVELNGGKCDGWLRAGLNDELAIGYYTQEDLGFFGAAAPEWTTFDRYFSAVMAETYPNRFYQHAGRTDRLHNNIDKCTLPTIWDRLADAGQSGKYYYSDVAFTLLWREHLRDISFPLADFLTDAAAGTLPAVSFVDPRFEDEPSGTSNDDHPHADIRAGEAFLNQVYDAIRLSPAWESTVLIINYDEWGGFYDHVAPTRAPDVSRRTSLRGFRTPAVLISPFARRQHVAHRTYDHTSILKMIAWRWGLEPLTPRDAQARNIAEVLDLAHPDPTSTTYTVPPFVATPCGSEEAESGPEAAEWSGLRQIGLELGWGVVS